MSKTVRNNPEEFRRALLAWYRKHKRVLPWRESADPYAIWLSEIMLQQTQVATVIPYYQKFLKRFPTLKSVAEAPEDELLRHWAGLGYYNRVRQFQKAARVVMRDFSGQVPDEFEALLSLPGLGDYTARAVASIAFGKPEAVVDGNVMRVLARLRAYGGEIKSGEAKRFFRTEADALLDRDNPGDFNQAMMELGATVCTPANPICAFCPVNFACQAHQRGEVARYPVNTKKTAYRQEEMAAIILTHAGEVLVRQREASQIMAGMWEFPLVTLEKTLEATIEEHVRRHAALKPKPQRPLKPVQHTIMNRRMKIFPVHLKLAQKTPGTWIAISELNRLALTTVSKKLIRTGNFS